MVHQGYEPDQRLVAEPFEGRKAIGGRNLAAQMQKMVGAQAPSRAALGNGRRKLAHIVNTRLGIVIEADA